MVSKWSNPWGENSIQSLGRALTQRVLPLPQPCSLGKKSVFFETGWKRRSKLFGSLLVAAMTSSALWVVWLPKICKDCVSCHLLLQLSWNSHLYLAKGFLKKCPSSVDVFWVIWHRLIKEEQACWLQNSPQQWLAQRSLTVTDTLSTDRWLVAKYTVNH